MADPHGAPADADVPRGAVVTGTVTAAVDRPARPARATRPRPITRLYQHRHVAAAVNQIEESAGGRTALVAALTALTGDDDLVDVLGVLADPRNDARKLAQICRDHAIPVGRILEAFKQGVLAKAYLESQRAIADGLPPVVRDVMQRAAPYEASCPDCSGTGTYSVDPDKAPGPCPYCKATGRRVVLPDLDRQKLALDLGGLTKRAPGVLVDNRSITLPPAAPGSFSALLAATDHVLHRGRGRSPVALPEPSVEGEVIPADPPDEPADG